VSDLGLRAVSAAGLGVMIGLAWLCSSDRRRVPWRTVLYGTALQLGLALLALDTEPGHRFFAGANDAVNALIGYVDEGSRFVFGALFDAGFSFVTHVLPTIVFMGSLFSVLYHLRLVQPVVRLMAVGLERTLGTSGAESLQAVANIFVGMVEAPLLVRPYLARMTQSELFSVMTTGMASTAGSVLVAYVQMLGGGSFAGHLVTASFLSAPAGIVIAKIMVPETATPETAAAGASTVARTSLNVVDAASLGAVDGLRLSGYVGAMLIAFVSLVALANAGLSGLGSVAGVPDLTFQRILGWIGAPLALAMGVPWHDATQVGSLLGVKTVLNEFLGYQQLGSLIRERAISERSAVIASYALCGFANFGSLAILLGGLGGMAPERRGDVARLGLRSIVSGSLASFMTACVAGVLL
jgi:CNT family concentrative nucleoside transporter